MLPKGDISFCHADSSHAELIRDIVRAAYSKWVPVIGREPLPMTVNYADAVSRNDFELACFDGAVVGVMETCLRDDHLWIENVAVLPDRQGKGIGRALLAHAERKAGHAGVPEVRLLTNEAFAANVALYARTGYAVDRRESFMGGTTVYMSKKVDGSAG